MGCSSTKLFSFQINDSVPGQNKEAHDLFIALHFSEYEINKLFTAYADMDADGSGFIRLDELMSYFNIEWTAFNSAVFGMFDVCRCQYLNFFDFVCVVSKNSTL